MSNSESKISKQSSLLVKALTRLLRPLIKLLIHNQLTFPMFSELLKSVYVDVAQKDFKLENKRVTDSRISVLTGVHRKDIRKLRAPNTRMEEPSTVSLGTQLISIWLTNSEYLNTQGSPKPLPRVAIDGVGFDTLVQQVGRQDIHPRSVLDDWLRLGVVEINENDEVVLLIDAFIPQKGFEEKLYFFEQNIHDHLGAVTNNVIGDKNPLLEQSVYYSNLSQESVDTLHLMARQLTTNVLKEIDKKARALKKSDRASMKTKGKFRMNFGSYFYKEATNEDGDSNE